MLLLHQPGDAESADFRSSARQAMRCSCNFHINSLVQNFKDKAILMARLQLLLVDWQHSKSRYRFLCLAKGAQVFLLPFSSSSSHWRWPGEDRAWVSVRVDQNLTNTCNTQAGIAPDFNSDLIEKQRIIKKPHVTGEKPPVNKTRSNSILIACRVPRL